MGATEQQCRRMYKQLFGWRGLKEESSLLLRTELIENCFGKGRMLDDFVLFCINESMPPRPEDSTELEKVFTLLALRI